MTQLPRGIIVSIQGYHYRTMAELAHEAIEAGCVGLRIDKHLSTSGGWPVPIVGLKKIKVVDVRQHAYITPTVKDVEEVDAWATMVAIDYREVNADLPDVARYCRDKKVEVVADIQTYDDFKRIKDRGLYYTWIATTLSVLSKKCLFSPDLRLIEKVALEEHRLIAEGNFSSRKDVKAAYDAGAHCVCIGAAISNVYKLTKKYTSVQA